MWMLILSRFSLRLKIICTLWNKLKLTLPILMLWMTNFSSPTILFYAFTQCIPLTFVYFFFFLKFYLTNLSLINNYWLSNQILHNAKCHSITLQSQNLWSLSIPISSFYYEKSFHHHHCFATLEFILIHVVDGLLN